MQRGVCIILTTKKTLAGIKIDEKDIQASFDVVALYPSIPVEKALHCVKEKLRHDESLADRTEWKVDDIMKLLTICLETHFKTNDGRIYTQIGGTPIGKSISRPLADIFMIWSDQEYIFNEKNIFKPYIKIIEKISGLYIHSLEWWIRSIRLFFLAA